MDVYVNAHVYMHKGYNSLSADINWDGWSKSVEQNLYQLKMHFYL